MTEKELFNFDADLLAELRDAFLKRNLPPRAGVCVMAYLVGWEIAHNGWNVDEVVENLEENIQRGMEAFCDMEEKRLLAGVHPEGSA